MPEPDLTDQQRQVIENDGSFFVEACPGAGKTRTLVARFLKRTEDEPRQGIALISFTNAAIDEVTRRCGNRPQALTVPNFVGTFDSFINRFITRPLYVRQFRRTPRFIDSWGSLGVGNFRIWDMRTLRLPDLELDWFELRPSLSRAVLRDSRLSTDELRRFGPLIAERRGVIEARASTYCRDLVRNGIVSCEASRALAIGYLADLDTYQLIGRLVANRFAEVIVDEAQDCGPEELTILRLLRDFEIDVVAVADLDQAIFEFRRADPEGVRTFGASLSTGLSLDGNFRSTAAICALNTSLRHGEQADRAVGQCAGFSTKIQILGFRHPGSLTVQVEDLATTHGLTQQEVVFLAHRGSDARKCAGRGETSAGGANRVLGIARAHAVLTVPTSGARERLRAVEAVERTLRAVARIAGQPDEPVDPELLDERWLRDAAIRLAVGIEPAVSTPGEYAAAVRQHVRQIVWPTGVTIADNLGPRLPAPNRADWLVAAQEGANFRAATIHSVKGQEFPGVVVVLPGNQLKDLGGLHAVDHWDSGTASECAA